MKEEVFRSLGDGDGEGKVGAIGVLIYEGGRVRACSDSAEEKNWSQNPPPVSKAGSIHRSAFTDKAGATGDTMTYPK